MKHRDIDFDRLHIKESRQHNMLSIQSRINTLASPKNFEAALKRRQSIRVNFGNLPMPGEIKASKFLPNNLELAKLQSQDWEDSSENEYENLSENVRHALEVVGRRGGANKSRFYYRL